MYSKKRRTIAKFEKGEFYAYVRLRDTRIKTKPVTRVI